MRRPTVTYRPAPATVEAAMRVDLREMLRHGQVRPGEVQRGTYTWIWANDVESAGAANFMLDLREPEEGIFELSFRHQGHSRSQSIRISSQPMRFGGWRFYFICPKLGHRCQVLVFDGAGFASRQNSRLRYASQYASETERLRMRLEKLEHRLWHEVPQRRARGRSRRDVILRWERTSRAFTQSIEADAARWLGRAVCA